MNKQHGDGAKILVKLNKIKKFIAENNHTITKLKGNRKEKIIATLYDMEKIYNETVQRFNSEVEEQYAKITKQTETHIIPTLVEQKERIKQAYYNAYLCLYEDDNNASN